jgi:hypothetical protein
LYSLITDQEEACCVHHERLGCRDRRGLRQRDLLVRAILRPARRSPPDGRLAEWHHTESGAVQVVRDTARGGQALLTLGVDDLDGFIADLSSRGLTVGDVIEGVIAHIASIMDPEGNVITLAQLYAAD